MISKVIDVPINTGLFGSKPSDQINLTVSRDYPNYRIVNIIPNDRNAFKHFMYYVVGIISLGFYYRSPGFLVILECVGEPNKQANNVSTAQDQ